MGKVLGLERKQLALQRPPSQDVLETGRHSERGRASAPCLPSGRGPPASLEVRTHACDVLNGAPQIRMWKSQAPVPSEVTLFGNGVAAAPYLGWAPHAGTGVLIKKENVETDRHPRRRPRDEGRGQGDAAISLGPPETASKPPGSRKEAGNSLSLTALRKNHPCRHSDPGLL